MTLSAYIQPSDILEQEEDISIEVEYFYSLAWHTHFTTAHTFYHIATFDHIATESLYKPLSRQNTPRYGMPKLLYSASSVAHTDVSIFGFIRSLPQREFFLWCAKGVSCQGAFGCATL